jgi:hypothetical protein
MNTLETYAALLLSEEAYGTIAANGLRRGGEDHTIYLIGYASPPPVLVFRDWRTGRHYETTWNFHTGRWETAVMPRVHLYRMDYWRAVR